MRDKNYRRKQEAKHYKQRVSHLSNGNLELLKDENLTDKEAKRKQRLINKLKTGDLKFGWMNKYDKKLCNKARRLLQKTVDFQLPSNIFLDRKHANPPVKGYNGDSIEDYYNWLLHGDWDEQNKRFEFDIYPDD